jgi:hypothetical protein
MDALERIKARLAVLDAYLKAIDMHLAVLEPRLVLEEKQIICSGNVYERSEPGPKTCAQNPQGGAQSA